MPKEIQQSVFLENSVGELADLCSELKSENVNIKAISVVDTGDFGVVRMVTSQPDRARDILKRRQIPFLESEVVTAQLPNSPGALADASRKLAERGINIQYVYGSAPNSEREAVVVLRVSAPSLADEILSQLQA